MEPARWLTAEEQKSWRAFLRGSRLLLGRLDADLFEALGLSLADYEILARLSEARGGLRMTELADQALVSRSRLTYRVDRLVAEGLVDRRPCAADRRGSLAVLTAAGRRRLDRAVPIHVDGVLSYLIDSCSGRDLAAIGRVFGSLVETLEKPGGDTPDLECADG